MIAAALSLTLKASSPSNQNFNAEFKWKLISVVQVLKYLFKTTAGSFARETFQLTESILRGAAFQNPSTQTGMVVQVTWHTETNNLQMGFGAESPSSKDYRGVYTNSDPPCQARQNFHLYSHCQCRL